MMKPFCDDPLCAGRAAAVMTNPDSIARLAASSDPMAVLEGRTPDVRTAEFEAIVLAQYGIAAAIEPLRSERDQNVLVTATDRRRWVLKLGHAAERQDEATFAARALRHIAAADPELPVPRVVATATGADCFRWSGSGGETRVGRLTSFVPGVPMAGQPRTALQVERFGTLAARLARALGGFTDPADGRLLPWDMRHALRAADLLPCIADAGDAQRAAEALERFRTDSLPRLGRLRSQVIHNDLNPSNVLVDPAETDRPCGIIDFGDLITGALVCDVAIAAAYLVRPGDDPLADVVGFVAAYHAATPLEQDELELLPDLIATRQAMSLAIGAWRARRDGDNAAYLLRNRDAASLGLEAVTTAGSAALVDRLHEACPFFPRESAG